MKTLKTEASQKAKEDQKKSKEEQKLKLKEEKLKLKEELKQKVVKSKAQSTSCVVDKEEEEGENQNVIVCTQIIKTGANKGSHCHLAVFNDLMCKRHYNLKNKKE